MKYIIEIEDIPFRARLCHAGEIVTLWRAKGFNSLVFDEEGLSRLEKYDPKGIKHNSYERGKANGLKDGWDCAWKVALMDNDAAEELGLNIGTDPADAIRVIKERHEKYLIRNIQTDLDTLMTSLDMSLEEIADKLKEMRG